MSTLPTPLRYLGAPGSPYTRKMRSLLRYRRIPCEMLSYGPGAGADLPRAKVHLLPTFFLPGADGALEAVTDSTPLIRRFEAAFEGRGVVPPDPALAFLDALLEDYGDEWLTKAMFHYRWAYPADVAKAAAVLPLWRAIDAPDAELAQASKMISERQVGRLYVVGSNETTAPVIEESYRRFLRVLDALLSRQPFAMGRRPGASDFALYGQLTQLACFDPTPAAVTLEESARVVAWVDVLEDLSGLDVSDDGWLVRDAARDTLHPLLCEMGRTYVPVMRANAAALANGAARVECEVEGRPWVQQPFPYQGKCLRWLAEAHAALAPDDRAFVDGVLEGSGCEALFASGRDA
jgi:glutathione S-transferase